jgi:hypothetical protein
MPVKRKPTGRPVGRPLELTPAVAKTICDNISIGLTFGDACLAAHISRKSFERWRDLGKDATEGPYYELLLMTEEAEAGFKRTHLKRIVSQSRKKSAGVWVCSAWLLERKFPAEFAMRSHVAITNKLDEFVKAFDELK